MCGVICGLVYPKPRHEDLEDLLSETMYAKPAMVKISKGWREKT